VDSTATVAIGRVPPGTTIDRSHASMTLRSPARHALLCVLVSLACACTAHHGALPRPVHVLLGGHSPTYVGNLPVVRAAQARAEGRGLSTQMLVQGGATLDDRVRDGSVAGLLQREHFDYVVLQERGGDVLCFQPGACEASERAHVALGELAHAHGAVPIVLGTYQSLPAASQALIDAERALAAEIHARFVPVSEKFRCAAATAPALDWHAADGMHPGHDLTLLMATRLYAALFGVEPRARALTVSAPMYGPDAHFDGSRPADAQSAQAAANIYRYDAARVAAVLKADAACTPGPANAG
jgi:hypothetical protein